VNVNTTVSYFSNYYWKFTISSSIPVGHNIWLTVNISDNSEHSDWIFKITLTEGTNNIIIQRITESEYNQLYSSNNGDGNGGDGDGGNGIDLSLVGIGALIFFIVIGSIGLIFVVNKYKKDKREKKVSEQLKAEKRERERRERERYQKERSRKKVELEQRAPMIDQLIQEKQFLNAIVELENMLNTADSYDLTIVLNWANNKLNLCKSLRKKEREKILAEKRKRDGREREKYEKERSRKKIELEQRAPMIDQLIQEKQFLNAIRELKDMLNIAESYNLANILNWANKKLNLCKIFERLNNLFKISEKVNLNDISSLLDIDRGDLIKRLIDWSNLFEFTIDGDYLKIKSQDIDVFMDLLDKSYEKWGSPAKKKQKKK